MQIMNQGFDFQAERIINKQCSKATKEYSWITLIPMGGPIGIESMWSSIDSITLQLAEMLDVSMTDKKAKNLRGAFISLWEMAKTAVASILGCIPGAGALVGFHIVKNKVKIYAWQIYFVLLEKKDISELTEAELKAYRKKAKKKLAEL